MTNQSFCATAKDLPPYCMASPKGLMATHTLGALPHLVLRLTLGVTEKCEQRGSYGISWNTSTGLRQIALDPWDAHRYSLSSTNQGSSWLLQSID